MLLYPNITLIDFSPIDGTILLQDNSDGKGSFIAKWVNVNPMPSQEQVLI